MKKFRLRFLQFMLLAAAVTLSIDVWLQITQSKSLCMTESCQVVGEYVHFGETLLIVAGAVFFWILWLISFFAGRYGAPWLWKTIKIMLLGAMAFDGALLGFQFVTVQERCLLCIGVALFLFAFAALLSWNLKKAYIFILAGAVWLGGFAANGILEYKISPASLDKIEVITREDNAKREWPRFYFFFGLHCAHCSKVLANLAVNNRDPFTWQLIPLNDSKKDLSRIKAILESGEIEKNVFLAVLEIENKKDEEIEPGSPPEEVIQGVKKAKEFFVSRGYKGVPILIVDENRGKRVVLQGVDAIMRYLKKKRLVVQTIDMSGKKKEAEKKESKGDEQ